MTLVENGQKVTIYLTAVVVLALVPVEICYEKFLWESELPVICPL